MYKIIYHHDLRLGEGLSEKDIDKIKKDLSENPIEANLFLITISANSDEQLDIYDAKFLVQKYFQKNPPYVIGIAKEKGHAFTIVEELMNECVEKYNHADLKAYLIGE